MLFLLIYRNVSFSDIDSFCYGEYILVYKIPNNMILRWDRGSISFFFNLSRTKFHDFTLKSTILSFFCTNPVLVRDKRTKNFVDLKRIQNCNIGQRARYFMYDAIRLLRASYIDDKLPMILLKAFLREETVKNLYFLFPFFLVVPNYLFRNAGLLRTTCSGVSVFHVQQAWQG